MRTPSRRSSLGRAICTVAFAVVLSFQLVSCERPQKLSSQNVGKTEARTQKATNVAVSPSSKGYYISYTGTKTSVSFAPRSTYDKKGFSGARQVASTSGEDKRCFALLGNLEPGTRYVYRVGSGRTGEFTAPSSSKSTILFLGDTQADPSSGEIATGILSDRRGADAVLIAGDLVNDEGVQGEWDAFFDASAFTTDTPTVSTAGNHTETSVFVPGDSLEGFDSFDLGAARIVVANSNLMGSKDADKIAQIKSFLDAAISSSPKPTLVLMHHPLFPVSQNPKDAQRAQTMQNNYGTILDKADVILCGHEHAYTRIQRDGITQIMGVASLKRYESQKVAGLQAVFDGPAVTTIAVDPRTLTFTTYDALGQIRDSGVVSLRQRTAGVAPHN